MEQLGFYAREKSAQIEEIYRSEHGGTGASDIFPQMD